MKNLSPLMQISPIAPQTDTTYRGSDTQSLVETGTHAPTSMAKPANRPCIPLGTKHPQQSLFCFLRYMHFRQLTNAQKLPRRVSKKARRDNEIPRHRKPNFLQHENSISCWTNFSFMLVKLKFHAGQIICRPAQNFQNTQTPDNKQLAKTRKIRPSDEIKIYSEMSGHTVTCSDAPGRSFPLHNN